MPIQGDVDTTYPDKLKAINIELLEPFRGAKQHHKMKCLQCAHEWEATPLSKLQNFKKWKVGGCPKCNLDRKLVEKKISRAKNIKQLEDRGLEILSNWDGRNSVGRKCVPLPVTVKNTRCGHTFTSNAVNLLRRNVECPVCATLYKTSNINAWSELNSARWRQTATDWQLYKSKVTSLTRKSYIANKKKINPDNLPHGRAGTKGAYHIDHIVPIRYCFENKIPAKLCSHRENLQMLGWLDNVSSRDNPKGKIPSIFEGWINIVNGEHA